MRLLRDLLNYFELLLAPLAGLVTAMVGAVVLLLLIARPGCACSTKEKAYQTGMRVDLRNLVAAQQRHRATRGSFTVQLPDSAFRMSTGVVPLAITASADEFEAEVAWPDRTDTRCRILVRGDEVQGPTCDEARRPRRWWAPRR